MGATVLTVAALLVLVAIRSAAAPYPTGSLGLVTVPVGHLLARFDEAMPTVSKSVALFIFFLNSFLLTRTVTRYLFATRTYLTAVIYTIVAVGMFLPHPTTVAALVSMTVIRASELLIRSFQRGYTFDLVFKGAFLFGLSPLIYGPAMWLPLALPLPLLLLRRRWREWITALAGMLAPLFLFSYGCWATGRPFLHTLTQITEDTLYNSNYTVFNRATPIPVLVMAGLLTLALALAAGSFVSSARTLRTRSYKVYMYFLLMLPVSMLPLVFPGRTVIGYSLLAIPCAVLIPYLFVRRKGALSAAVYLSLVLACIAANIIPLL